MNASPYADKIRLLMPNHDPRHVEAYMRVSYPCLDGLSEKHFYNEALISAFCADHAGAEAAEALAASFGL